MNQLLKKKHIMKSLSVIIQVIILATCTLTGCVSASTDSREKELAISRYLERAIEVGEKKVSCLERKFRKAYKVAPLEYRRKND